MILFRSAAGQWRQIFAIPPTEGCFYFRSVNNFPPATMLLKMAKKYASTVPTNCPIPQGLQDHQISISSNNLIADEFIWGNFYPPSGFYKFKLNAWTTNDPEVVQIEWVIEIKPKRGEMSEAEW
jgi:Protein of unknown function (DUF1091)